MYEVREQETGEKLAGSNDRETAISLAVMLATQPVRQQRTWSSTVVQLPGGEVVATINAEGQTS